MSNECASEEPAIEGLIGIAEEIQNALDQAIKTLTEVTGPLVVASERPDAGQDMGRLSELRDILTSVRSTARSIITQAVGINSNF